MKFELFNPMALNELGQRDNQEDSIFPALGAATVSDRLFLVCDGMGGHEKGEVASNAVCQSVSQWINDHIGSDGILDDEDVDEAIKYARKKLDELDDGSLKKMGTTLTMVCLHSGGVTMGHIGDSRVYHIRPSQRRILYKTIDHSLVYDLFMAGDITYDQMATSSRRNVITRALMPGEDNDVSIDLAHTTDVLPGDYFYLCSDGMLEQMTDAELIALLASETSDESKIEQLRAATMGNKDNHSAYLIKVKGVSSEVGDDQHPNDEKNSHYNEVALLAKMAANAMNPQPQQASPLEQLQHPAAAPAPQQASPMSAAPAAVPVMEEGDDQVEVVTAAEPVGRRANARQRFDDEDFDDDFPDMRKKKKSDATGIWLKLLIGILALAVIAGAAILIMKKMGKNEDNQENAQEMVDQLEKNTGNPDAITNGVGGGSNSNSNSAPSQNASHKQATNPSPSGSSNGGGTNGKSSSQKFNDLSKAANDAEESAQHKKGKEKYPPAQQQNSVANKITNPELGKVAGRNQGRRQGSGSGSVGDKSKTNP